MQTNADLRTGNCFAACVASLMDLPLDAVPNFAVAGEDWWFRSYIAWIACKGLQGWGALLPEEIDRVPRGVPVILGVPSKHHAGALHAVIGQFEHAKWRVIHDPYPGEPCDCPHGEPVDAQWWTEELPNGEPYAWSARELDADGQPVWGPMETRP